MHYRSVLILVVALFASLLFPLAAGAVAPANDDMASPTAITGAAFTDNVDVIDATLEGGEPTPSCEYGTPNGSVWYAFSPASNGTLELHASGGFKASSFTMAVFETSPAGTQLKCHAESSPDIELAFTSGTVYYVQVRGEINGDLSTLTLDAAIYGTISGTVVDGGASPLQSISVSAWERVGIYYSVLGSAVTDASGNYSIAIPPSDTVVVKFVGAGYASEWYDDEAFQVDALDIDVDPGVTVTGVNATLAGDSTLTVTVKDLLGNPVSAAWVKLYSPSGTYLFGGTTNGSGVRALTGLKAATYHIQYSKSGYVTEWHDEAVDHGSSTGVVIGTDVDVVMEEAIVADSNDPFVGATTISSLPFQGAASMQGVGMDVDEPEPSCKYLLADGSRWWSYTPSVNERLAVMLTGTDSTQRIAVYTGASPASLTEVACGNRIDAFDAAAGTTYWIQAHGYTVTSSNEVEFTIGGSGALDVTVKDSGGDVIVGEEVCIYRSDSSVTEVGCATTDGSGLAAFEAPAGSYKARAAISEDGDSIVTWYDGAESHGSAAPVVVAVGATTEITLSAGTFDPQVGLVDPTQGYWYLRNGKGETRQFFFGNPGDFPILGDWDCDGVDTPGMYRQSDGYVYLRNDNSQGIADIRFFFGNPGDVPIVGDFDDDGCDSVSIFRPTEGRVFIMNELGENDGGLGAAEFDYYFGNPGDKPFVGDFDGDGVDTVGLHRESTGFVYFRNTHTQGIAHNQFFFGDPGDRLIAGDWGIVDGTDTPAIFRPSTDMFYFRHTNTQGNADSTLPWAGAGDWLPVAGDFGDWGGGGK